MLGADGRDLYAWTNADGGSLAQSVRYVVPYALGDKTHREWVHSKVDLDRRRAEAGLEKYRRVAHADRDYYYGAGPATSDGAGGVEWQTLEVRKGQDTDPLKQ